ncbi:HET-domain-containing protein [Corynespora cassiicola Philippines]|uniref:HET-domain-containing protein n=1 Tax=Corynespora cassiicola Philippines TaxID=1448308 RepID=A0A2T2NJN9_CORCC|nr:HET-domain-containing protein [Corynespora cassiicola Philippines]
MSNGAAQYMFSPLVDDGMHIRLLRLLPSATPDAKIRSEVVHFQFRETQTSYLYEALSYVWGDQNNKKRIQIGDDYLDVTANLYAALRRLRDPDFSRLIWVDALCINQDDFEERASQVNFMARIYSLASRVLVWLGEEAEGSSIVFSKIRDAAYQKQKQIELVWHEDMVRDKENVHNDLKGAETQVAALLQRTWFQRVWVLQEVAAAQSLLIICGKEEVNEVVFCRGLRLLLQFDTYRGSSWRTIESILYLIEWQPKNRHHMWQHNASLGILPLLQLVETFRAQKATDRRDKIYALLGLSTDASELKIRANYLKPWEELLVNLLGPTLGVHATITMQREWNCVRVHANACIIGRIHSVSAASTGTASHDVRLDVARSIRGTTCHSLASWVVRDIDIRIETGDILCLVKEARLPMLIRTQKDRLVVVAIALQPPSSLHYLMGQSLGWSKLSHTILRFNQRICFSWSPELYGIDRAGLSVHRAEFLYEDGSYMDMSTHDASNLSDMARVYEAVEDREGIREMANCWADKLYHCKEGSSYRLGLQVLVENWTKYLQFKEDFGFYQLQSWGFRFDKSYDAMSGKDWLSFWRDIGLFQMDFWELFNSSKNFRFESTPNLSASWNFKCFENTIPLRLLRHCSEAQPKSLVHNFPDNLRGQLRAKLILGLLHHEQREYLDVDSFFEKASLAKKDGLDLEVLLAMVEPESLKQIITERTIERLLSAVDNSIYYISVLLEYSAGNLEALYLILKGVAAHLANTKLKRERGWVGFQGFEPKFIKNHKWEHKLTHSSYLWRSFWILTISPSGWDDLAKFVAGKKDDLTTELLSTRKDFWKFYPESRCL